MFFLLSVVFLSKIFFLRVGMYIGYQRVLFFEDSLYLGRNVLFYWFQVNGLFRKFGGEKEGIVDRGDGFFWIFEKQVFYVGFVYRNCQQFLSLFVWLLGNFINWFLLVGEGVDVVVEYFVRLQVQIGYIDCGRFLGLFVF